MGLPGPLRRDSGEVGDSAILPGWIGSRPQELMEAELDLPVQVENDANLGALAEIVWGAGRDCSDVMYLKVATGVGAGLVLNGRLYHGSTGTAGEIGHMTIDEGGPICRCGNRGCLETFAGAEAILEPLRRRDGEDLTVGEVIDRAKQEDVGCRRALGDAGRALGLAVAGACNLLAPERVVVGGDLAAAGDLLLDPLREVLSRSAIASLREIPVDAGVLGERAEVLGAVALVLRESKRVVADPVPIG
jgi:predicted NBD/HSP70 family sugar kinase